MVLAETIFHGGELGACTEAVDIKSTSLESQFQILPLPLRYRGASPLVVLTLSFVIYKIGIVVLIE